MANLRYVHKIGENGATLTATLSDAAGVINTTGYTVTLNVSRGTIANGRASIREAIIVDAPCTGAGASGVVTCLIDDTFDVLDRPGDYLAEFKLVNGTTVLYWPKDAADARTFFTFEVQRSLD